MHLRSLERFSFDSVLLPYNFLQMREPGYARDFERLVARCAEGGVAVQTIKSIARRRWEEGAALRTTTWYEPLEDQVSIDHGMHWVLSRPGVFLNTVGDIRLLPKVLDAASRFQAGPTAEQMERDLASQQITPLFS